jgi:hypothetical protein
VGRHYRSDARTATGGDRRIWARSSREESDGIAGAWASTSQSGGASITAELVGQEPM